MALHLLPSADRLPDAVERGAIHLVVFAVAVQRALEAHGRHVQLRQPFARRPDHILLRLLRVEEADPREGVVHLPPVAVRVFHRRPLAVLDVDDVDVQRAADSREPLVPRHRRAPRRVALAEDLLLRRLAREHHPCRDESAARLARPLVFLLALLARGGRAAAVGAELVAQRRVLAAVGAGGQRGDGDGRAHLSVEAARLEPFEQLLRSLEAFGGAHPDRVEHRVRQPHEGVFFLCRLVK
mmetsp:Transcript_31293/g.78014  ORF Transcript_31293/g.78014 Transcript_31293/m.78014 type:complete len:240 (-) Transcript_31293:733-1452(-)